MHEFRIHGRGGQGVITVGQLIAAAFFRGGFHVQTFATYGGERRGAPVTAFVRASARPIHRRCDVEHPGVVLLFEPTFVEDGSGLAGLLPGATLVINTVQDPDAFSGCGPFQFATIDALRIARDHGLNRIVNTAMLGAFCRLVGEISLDEMAAVVQDHVPHHAQDNLNALHAAYAQVRSSREVTQSA